MPRLGSMKLSLALDRGGKVLFCKCLRGTVRHGLDRRTLYVKPSLQIDEAVHYAKTLYGLHVSAKEDVKELVSYNDKNFYLKGRLNGAKDESEYVLKVLNATNSYKPGFLQAMGQAMIHVNESPKGIPCCIPVRSLSGSMMHQIELPISDPIKTFSLYFGGPHLTDHSKIRLMASSNPLLRLEESCFGAVTYFMPHYVKLLTFVPGKPISFLPRIPDELLVECGFLAAKMQSVLRDFDHPEMTSQRNVWNLESTCDLEDPYLKSIKDKEKHSMIRKVIEEFKTLPNLEWLPKQIVHGDLNHVNILVPYTACEFISAAKCRINTFHDHIVTDNMRLSGLIDFGEISYTCRVFDLAICMAYLSIQRPQDPIRAAMLVLRGYKKLATLTPTEQLVLPTLVKARLAQTLAIGYYQYHVIDPTNEYLLTTNRKGWGVLRKFLAMDNRALLHIFSRS